jgi:hypothetical protein
MKKIVLTTAIAASLIAASASASFAATSAPKPTIKSTAGAEGTAKHEMSETSGTQKAESTKSTGMTKTGKTKTKKKAMK